MTAKPSPSVWKDPELAAASFGARFTSTVAPRTGSPVESFVTHTSVPSRDTFAEMPMSVICTTRARVARRSSRVPGRSVNGAFFAALGRSLVEVAPSLASLSSTVPSPPSVSAKTSSSLSASATSSSSRTFTATSGTSRFSLASRYVPWTPMSARGQRSSKSIRLVQSWARGCPYSSRSGTFAPPGPAIVERSRTVKLFAAPKRPSSVTQLVAASSPGEPQFSLTGGSITMACRKSRSFTELERRIETSDPAAHLRWGVSRSHASSSTSSGP